MNQNMLQSSIKARKTERRQFLPSRRMSTYDKKQKIAGDAIFADYAAKFCTNELHERRAA